MKSQDWTCPECGQRFPLTEHFDFLDHLRDHQKGQE